MSTETTWRQDPVADFIRTWTCPGWWQYLLTNCHGLAHFWCRARGHPDGPIWHNPGGTEPNMRCINCGEYLG